MRTAVLADIHGNLEALEAVTRHAGSHNPDRYVCLGDSVGYGADPNECMAWALQDSEFSLMGNHEKAVIEPSLREWFNPDAREAVIWTESVLHERYKKAISALPYLRIQDGLVFAHGTPDEPEHFNYLMTYHDAVRSFRAFEEKICFIGHTHVPSFFTYPTRKAGHFPAGVLKLNAAERYLLNPGSVGQPRDGDRRASYGIYDDRNLTFEIFRVEYDNAKAARKIRKAGLPRFLADRLL